MASFNKVNPNPDGNAVVTGLRPLEFFEIDAGNAAARAGATTTLANSTVPNGGMTWLIQTMELNSTIEILGQVGTINMISTGATSNIGNGVRVAFADIGTWGSPSSVGATNLQANIRALGVLTVGNANVGFANVNFSNATVYPFTF